VKNDYLIERHAGKRWIPTASYPTKSKGLEGLDYFRDNPAPDASEYRLVRVVKEELAWLDTGESVYKADHDAQKLSSDFSLSYNQG